METVTLNHQESNIANAIWTLIANADEKIKIYILQHLQSSGQAKKVVSPKATSTFQLKSENELSPKVRQLIGIIPSFSNNPEDDNKRIREQYLKEKFGL